MTNEAAAFNYINNIVVLKKPAIFIVRYTGFYALNKLIIHISVRKNIQLKK
jgi:hypothetical protein